MKRIAPLTAAAAIALLAASNTPVFAQDGTLSVAGRIVR